jgi:metal-responsive CopG/Arc/MetJ family transcriptional regulator
MTTQTKMDRTEKITISIPASLLATIDELVKERKSNRSAVIAELVRKLEREKFEAEMRDAYLENAEEAQQIAEEWFPLEAEIWPEWDAEEDKE